MKPWEGKHWKEVYNLFLDRFVESPDDENHNYLTAYKMIEWALIRDCQEQEKSKSTDESQISNKENYYNLCPTCGTTLDKSDVKIYGE